MNVTNQRIPVFEIARLACQIWQDGGHHGGRDREYWLLAEHQLRVSRQSERDEANLAPTKRKIPQATGTKSAGNL